MSEEQPWLSKYLRNVSNNLVNAGVSGITLDVTSGVIVDAANLSEDDYKTAFTHLSAVQSKNRIIATAVDRFIGQLILNYVASRDVSIEEAVSQLSLEEHTGKAYKTLAKLPRMVAQLPNEAFSMPNLTTMHFEAVTSFGGPKDNPEHMQQFNADRMALLETISQNPAEWTKSKVGGAMREIQDRYAVQRRTVLPISEIRDQFMAASVMLEDWEDDDFDAAGVTREQTLSYWRERREMLIEKNVLGETVSPPWVAPVAADAADAGAVIEAEIVQNNNPEPEGEDE